MCPKCNTRLGEFDWNGAICPCGTFVKPWFRIAEDTTRINQGRDPGVNQDQPPSPGDSGRKIDFTQRENPFEGGELGNGEGVEGLETEWIQNVCVCEKMEKSETHETENGSKEGKICKTLARGMRYQSEAPKEDKDELMESEQEKEEEESEEQINKNPGKLVSKQSTFMMRTKL